GRARVAVRPLRRLREDVYRHRSAIRPRPDLRPGGLPLRRRPYVPDPVWRIRPHPWRTRSFPPGRPRLPDRALRGLPVLESAVTRTIRDQGAGPATPAEPRLRPATSGPRP